MNEPRLLDDDFFAGLPPVVCEGCRAEIDVADLGPEPCPAGTCRRWRHSCGTEYFSDVLVGCRFCCPDRSPRLRAMRWAYRRRRGRKR